MPTPDELAAERRRKAAAAAIVYDTEQDDPDAVARDLRIARELSQASERRVPRSLVSQYRPEFQQLSDLERARKILAASPKLAEWGIDPDNAAQSKDDLERLARIERLAGDGWIKQPTAENVNADPKSRMSTSEVVLGHAKELGKGFASGAISGLVGMGMEGTGQLLSGLSDQIVHPTVEGHYNLARRISQARYVPQAEVEAINRDIDKLAAASGSYGSTSFGQAQDAQIAMMRQTLSDVLDGRRQPKEAFDLLQPMFGGLSPVVIETTAGKRAALAERISHSKDLSKRQLATLERDIDQLLTWRPERDAARATLGQVRSGAVDSDKALDALQRSLGFPLEVLGRDLQRAGEEVQNWSGKTFEADKGFENSPFRKIGEVGGVALGITGAYMADPALGIAVAVGAGAGSGASDARKSGGSESEQTEAALVNGAAGTLNVLPYERLLFSSTIVNKGILGIGERFAKGPVTGGVKNAAQTFVQDANAAASYDPNRNWYSGLWDSFVSGLVVDGALGLGRGVFRTVTGKDSPAPTAEQKQAAANAAFDEAAGSTTRERAPETFESFSTPAFKDGPIENVHLRAAVLDEHSRSQGMDPLTVVDTLNGVSRKDYATAMTVDGDLRIPSAAYAARIAGSDADAALRPHLRVDPAYTTTATPEVFPHSQDDASRAAAQAVHDGTIIELGAAGYSPEAAASEALLRSTLYRTMATRAGTNPMPPILPASPDALLQSDIPVLNSDGLMNSTSPLALDGRDKAAPSKILPETMNDVEERVDPNPIYGPDRPRNHWED